MKIRDKKTGAIYSIGDIDLSNNQDGIWLGLTKYTSLAELNEDWEDVEEPKEYWCITMYGGITRIKDNEALIDDLIKIGNCFNSKEDAYDALDKLKAWKRLRDEGFKFKTWGWENEKSNEYTIWFELNDKEGDCSDLELLFGGEE